MLFVKVRIKLYHLIKVGQASLKLTIGPIDEPKAVVSTFLSFGLFGVSHVEGIRFVPSQPAIEF